MRFKIIDNQQTMTSDLDPYFICSILYNIIVFFRITDLVYNEQRASFFKNCKRAIKILVDL